MLGPACGLSLCALSAGGAGALPHTRLLGCVGPSTELLCACVWEQTTYPTHPTPRPCTFILPKASHLFAGKCCEPGHAHARLWFQISECCRHHHAALCAHFSKPPRPQSVAVTLRLSLSQCFAVCSFALHCMRRALSCGRLSLHALWLHFKAWPGSWRVWATQQQSTVY